MNETIFGTPDSVLFSGGKTVIVLGTPYNISIRAYSDDPNFEKHNFAGYCDGDFHSIVLLDLKTCEDWKDAGAI